MNRSPAARIEKSQSAEMQWQVARQNLYVADMKVAQHSLEMNNLGQIVELLDRHRPKPGEADLRGWEWRYLWEQCQSDALFTLTNTPPPSMGCLPDRTYMVEAQTSLLRIQASFRRHDR
jgi:hypothetical protein